MEMGRILIYVTDDFVGQLLGFAGKMNVEYEWSFIFSVVSVSMIVAIFSLLTL